MPYFRTLGIYNAKLDGHRKVITWLLQGQIKLNGEDYGSYLNSFVFLKQKKQNKINKTGIYSWSLNMLTLKAGILLNMLS